MSRKSSRPSSAASSRPATGDPDFKYDCKAAFLSIFDDLKDKIYSEDDLSAVLQQAGRNPSRKTLEKYWTPDTDYLTFEDFVNICRNVHSTTVSDLMKAFKKIDINGDGYISLDELYRMLTTRGERMSRQEVKEMIDEVDENRDGRLDYGEFCNMLMKTTEECKKMSVKLMEKKERKKKGGRSEYSTTPRRADSRAPSHSSLRSVGRTGSKSSLISIDDMPRQSPRVRSGKVMPAVASSKSSRLPEPSNLKEWTHCSSKGCLFIDSDEGGQVLSHQYILYLPSDNNVYITIHPTKIADGGMTDDGPIDTALYILREKSSSIDRVVTFTEQRDSKGKYAARCDLPAGRYRLIPFTTGCRLRERRSRDTKEAKLIKKEKDDKVVLTKSFKRVLEDIFDMSDLDCNGLLSREEFNWFNIRTSGESVADDEWEVVEGNIDMDHGEITKQGFVQLNQMEAEDNDGEADDLWVTVSSMGFNRALTLDQACPFKLDVYTEDCDEADLRVDTLEGAADQLEEAICEAVIAKGEVSSVKGLRDLNVYTYTGDARATIVVENKSHSRVKVELDCSKSKNVVSNQRDLVYTVTVPANRTMVGLHLIPRDERSDWLVKCNETIQK